MGLSFSNLSLVFYNDQTTASNLGGLGSESQKKKDTEQQISGQNVMSGQSKDKFWTSKAGTMNSRKINQKHKKLSNVSKLSRQQTTNLTAENDHVTTKQYDTDGNTIKSTIPDQEPEEPTMKKKLLSCKFS